MWLLDIPTQLAPGILFSMIRKDGMLLFNTNGGTFNSKTFRIPIIVASLFSSTFTACSVTMTMLMRRLGSILGIKMIMKQMVSSTICVTILVVSMLSITKISDLGVMLWKSLLSVVLGSGKTSTINHLIADALENNLNPAVIMNEFGRRSVDGQLIERPEVPMSEITEGCICCAMKSDVSQQLHELYLKYQPDIIFIECSGVAEPLAVVDACFTPVLAPFITL